MTRGSLIVVALLASCIHLAPALAQNAYRCGSSYSQTPCPGAVAVDVSDKRTSEQKAQAEEVSQREQKLADSMERSRLEQEEAQRKAAAKSAKPPADKSATKEKDSGKHTRIVKTRPKTPEKGNAKTAGSKKSKNSDSAAPLQVTPATLSAAK